MSCTVVGVVAVKVVGLLLLLLLVPQPITSSSHVVASQQRHYSMSQQQQQHRSPEFRGRTIEHCFGGLQSNEFFVTTGKNIPRGGSSDADDDDDRRNRSNVEEDEVKSTLLPSSVPTNIIRIRMLDGTVQKVSVLEWTTLSVVEAIRQSVAVAQRGRTLAVGSSFHITLPNGSTVTGHVDHPHENDSANDRINDNDILSKSLDDLGVKHGSLVTIHSNGPDVTFAKAQSRSTTTTSKWKTRHRHHQQQRFDPFPELAKDYDAAVRQAKIKRNGASSYSTIAALQASLHTVDPQSIGTIQRIYMCHVAAAKFQARGMDTNDRHHGGIALLLGTITTERKDLHQPKKARTSLSSTVESDQYCCAARVHAIWEPPLLKKGSAPLDQTNLLLSHLSATDTTNVIRVAQYLGLQPIGWMFSYSDDRTTSHLDSNLNEGGLPVWGKEIEIGARLQMEYMKKYCRENDSVPRFGTLAMDARSGATEAFQLSDVAVQMVAEDMFVLGENLGQGNDRSGRYITTRYPVIVDGKETNQLDSVLCLVNVALLSHTGMFTGSATTLSSKKQRDGKISNKTRKAILKAIDAADNDALENNGANSEIFGIINDFNILLAIDEILTEEDSKQLCTTLYKWARGQKKSVKLDSQLTKRLRRALDATM